jgi:hypothetical protein
MQLCDIYKITCMNTNKVYIGQTIQVYTNGRKADTRNVGLLI